MTDFRGQEWKTWHPLLSGQGLGHEEVWELKMFEEGSLDSFFFFFFKKPGDLCNEEESPFPPKQTHSLCDKYGIRINSHSARLFSLLFLSVTQLKQL